MGTFSDKDCKKLDSSNFYELSPNDRNKIKEAEMGDCMVVEKKSGPFEEQNTEQNDGYGIRAKCDMQSDGKALDQLEVAVYKDTECKEEDEQINLIPMKCKRHPWVKGKFTKLVRWVKDQNESGN